MAKKLKGILIEVNGGVVSYVEFNGKPAAAYHLFDWDELLGDSDTRRAWESLSTEEQEFLRDRYPTKFEIHPYANPSQISSGTISSMAAPAPGRETNPNQTPTAPS